MDLFDVDKIESAFHKDKHATVRVLLQESRRLGSYRRETLTRHHHGPGHVNGDVLLLTVFIATYVIEMSILCVDAKVLPSHHTITPSEINFGEYETRILETHEFPMAVRRAITLSDELHSKFLLGLKEKLGDKLVFPFQTP